MKNALIVLLIFWINSFSFAQTYNSGELNASLDDDNCGSSSNDFVMDLSNENLPLLNGTHLILRQVCVDITHTFAADLEISLIAPDNTVIDLSSDNGSFEDNYSVTCFNDNGINGSIVNGSAPFNGSYIPEQSLSIMHNGQDPNGSWTLSICDDLAADTGILDHWSIEFEIVTPSNDQCSDAIPLICNAPAQFGTTYGTTLTAAPNSCASDYGVWYTMVGDGSYMTINLIETQDTDFEFDLFSTDSDCSVSLTQIVCQDNSLSNESYTFLSEIGESYLVYVAHYLPSSDSKFNFEIELICNQPPSNDLCLNAEPLGFSQSITLDMTYATSIDAPVEPCGGGGGSTDDPSTVCSTGTGTIDVGEGVWYVIESSMSEEITVEVEGFDTELQVFEGPCNALTCVTGDDDGGNGLGSKVCWVSTASADGLAPVQYYIYVDGHSSNNGTFTISTMQSVLPVSLDRFSARQDGRYNQIKWTTLSEINVDQHIVMKSEDAINWYEMDSISGQMNSSTKMEYSILDVMPYETTYYRLVSVDHDGSVDYSSIVSVMRDVSSHSVLLGVSPVPTIDNVALNIYSQGDDNFEILVFDVSGKELQSTAKFLNEGNHQITVNLQDYQSGVYIVRIESDYLFESIKVIKE